MWKRYEAFRGSRGSCTKPGQFPVCDLRQRWLDLILFFNLGLMSWKVVWLDGETPVACSSSLFEDSGLRLQHSQPYYWFFQVVT